MAEYRNDLAWIYLSEMFSATPAEATLQDLYLRWMDYYGLTHGESLANFFVTETGINNVGDAEWEYWRTAPQPWTPEDVGTYLWLDASDATTITEGAGGAVSQWNDKSGNSRHLSQATAASQPRTGTRTINDLNVIDFDSDFLTSVAAASTWSVLHDGTYHLIGIVYARDIAGFNATLLCTKTVAFSLGVHIHPTSTNNFRHNVQNGATNVVDNVRTLNVSTSPQLITLFSDPTNATVADRSIVFLGDDTGQKTNIQTGTTSASAPSQTLTIGDRPAAPLPLNGVIAEIVIIVGADATEANRILLRDYLKRKWGI